MLKNKILASYKLLVAVLVFTAICTQFASGLSRDFSIVNFFSFFTIESNIFAAILFVVSSSLLWTGGKSNKHLTMLRGAATLYMATTGIVYALLLSGMEESLQTPVPWINFVLHYFFPVVAVLDWIFIDRSHTGISFKKSLLWISFPLAYVAYSLIRGPIAHWYPYPFLNPADGGYLKVFVVSVGISAAVLLLCAILAATSPKQTVVKKR